MLNEEKFVFADPVVEFTGFKVNPESFSPLQRIISSIENFPSPRNITDIHSWFGMVNQVAYTFTQADIMQLFRDLLASKETHQGGIESDFPWKNRPYPEIPWKFFDFPEPEFLSNRALFVLDWEPYLKRR